MDLCHWVDHLALCPDALQCPAGNRAQCCGVYRDHALDGGCQRPVLRRHGVHCRRAVCAQAAPQPIAASRSTGLASHVRASHDAHPPLRAASKQSPAQCLLASLMYRMPKHRISDYKHTNRLPYWLGSCPTGHTQERRQRRSEWRWKGSSCGFCWGLQHLATLHGCGGCRSALARHPAVAPALEPRTQVHIPCCCPSSHTTECHMHVRSGKLCCQSGCTNSAGTVGYKSHS